MTTNRITKITEAVAFPCMHMHAHFPVHVANEEENILIYIA